METLKAAIVIIVFLVMLAVVIGLIHDVSVIRNSDQNYYYYVAGNERKMVGV
jgi:uncharacterized membrane protein